MGPRDEPITDLTLNSEHVDAGPATLRRTEDALPSGLLGSSDWQVELPGRVPGNPPDVRVELTAGGVNYTGAGRIEDEVEDASGRTTIVANGPLISYTRTG